MKPAKQCSPAFDDAANAAVYRLGLIQLLDFVEECKISTPELPTDSTAVEDDSTNQDATSNTLKKKKLTENCPCGCIACSDRSWCAVNPQSNQPQSKKFTPLILAHNPSNSEIWDILKEVSRTGHCMYPWNLVKVVLATKLSWAFDSLAKLKIRNSRIFDWDRARNSIVFCVMSFTSPPIAFQRMCELALCPIPEDVEKFYYAIRKIMKGRDIGTHIVDPPITLDARVSSRLKSASQLVDDLLDASGKMPGARIGSFKLNACTSAHLSDTCCSTCMLCKDWMEDIICTDDDFYGNPSLTASSSLIAMLPESEAVGMNNGDLNHSAFPQKVETQTAEDDEISTSHVTCPVETIENTT